MKKKEREKRNLSLLGFKTLNIKSRDQIFPPPINIITKLRLRERVVVSPPPPLSSLFDFSFFVVGFVVRETTTTTTWEERLF